MLYFRFSSISISFIVWSPVFSCYWIIWKDDTIMRSYNKRSILNQRNHITKWRIQIQRRMKLAKSESTFINEVYKFLFIPYFFYRCCIENKWHACFRNHSCIPKQGLKEVSIWIFLGLSSFKIGPSFLFLVDNSWL